jgi:pilus assembly protein CpaB
MGRRTLLLIASILVAALGTALIWLYVQGADNRAQSGEAQVRTIVSLSTVDPGTSATSLQLRERTFPRSFVDSFGPGLITDPTKIQGYAQTRIVAGMPLLSDQFGNTPTAPTPAVEFDPSKLVMEFSLPDPQRLAGILQPGDLIRIFVAQQTGTKAPEAKVLLDKVKVVTSGPVAATANNSTTGGRAQVPQANVTLEVSNDQALTLVQTQSQGSGGNNLWFGLLGTKTPPAQIPGGVG